MPDIVFAPTHTGEDGSRLEDLLFGCVQGHTDSWTCKKTASKGDLYLFYFGEPDFKLRAVGVCANNEPVEEENDGTWDWTKSPRGWFCKFSPLQKLSHPITKDELAGDPILATWWKTRPFQGRPKSVDAPRSRNANWSNRLLQLIGQQNSRLRGLLRKYTTLPSNEGMPISTRPLGIRLEDDENPPDRVEYTSSRPIRNTAKGDALKELYEWRCQICEMTLEIPGGRYAEVHHLRPLGRNHRGKDNHNNMLVVCPSCHAQFDRGAIAIDPKTRTIVHFKGVRAERRSRILLLGGHELERANVLYHWREFTKTAYKR